MREKGEVEIPILIPALAVRCDGDEMAEVQGAGASLRERPKAEMFHQRPGSETRPR